MSKRSREQHQKLGRDIPFPVSSFDWDQYPELAATDHDAVAMQLCLSAGLTEEQAGALIRRLLAQLTHGRLS